MKKRKVLFCTEASYAYTGFSKYAKEVISKLYESRDFEIAEFASYAKLEDDKLDKVPWKVYANEVGPQDKRYKSYKSNAANQFGEWRFEKVVLDFRPDIVVAYRDFWYDTYIVNSPLLPYFHLCWMPTCDSIPISEKWVSSLLEVDALFSYNDWAGREMLKSTNGKANYVGSAPPAVDTEIFCPIKNKAEHKKSLGLPEGHILGMVSRNQVRKLFPDLLLVFEDYLGLCKKKGKNYLADNTYLYLHTSYPDIRPWDIPFLLKERPISNKVIFSYVCNNCKHWQPLRYSGIRTVCPKCGKFLLALANVNNGVDDKSLAQIYQAFDLCIQYSTCGGFEIAQIEAASCGVPVMSTNYSSMEDIIQKINGTKIKVQRMFRDIGTGALRALPDNSDTAQQIYRYFSSAQKTKNKKGRLARKGVLQHYTWEKTALIWHNHLLNCKLKNGWDNPPVLHEPKILSEEKINGMGDYDFYYYICNDVLNESAKLNTYNGLSLFNAIVNGICPETNSKITREQILERSIKMANTKNNLELIRCGLKNLPKEDFLNYANS